jgi:hypothetical protein
LDRRPPSSELSLGCWACSLGIGCCFRGSQAGGGGDGWIAVRHQVSCRLAAGSCCHCTLQALTHQLAVLTSCLHCPHCSLTPPFLNHRRAWVQIVGEEATQGMSIVCPLQAADTPHSSRQPPQGLGADRGGGGNPRHVHCMHRLHFCSGGREAGAAVH